MAEPQASCSNCGASVAGRVCAFCGSLDGALEGPGNEPLAIAERHRFLGEAKPERAAELLLHAFLPATAEGLIDAGTRSLLLVDEGSITPLGKAAARRLLFVLIGLLAWAGHRATSRGSP